MKLIAFTFTSLLALAAVTACNTVDGAGQDIEEVGEEVSETSNEVAN